MIAEEAKMDFSETRKYIGHLDQLFNIKTFRYCGGKAEGMLIAVWIYIEWSLRV